MTSSMNLHDFGGAYVLCVEIYGNRLGPEAIPGYIQDLDPKNALTSLSKAVWALENNGHLDRRVQLFLAKEFLPVVKLPEATDLILRRRRFLFFRDQIHTLMKFVAKYGKVNDTRSPIQKPEKVNLGIALFAATDLIAEESMKIRDALKQEERLSSHTFQLIA